MSKISKILFIFLLFISFKGVDAQNSINAPYSRYGIGEIMGNTQTALRSMGGISYGVRKNTIINPSNPASYTSFDTLSFIFDIGVQFKQSQLSNTSIKQNTNNASVSRFAVGFPIFRWWKSSIGILPISNLEYQTEISGYDSIFGSHSYKYGGSGGFRKAYWGNSFSPMKNLSIGANLNFVFGNLNTIRTNHFDTITIFDARYVNNTYVNNLTLDFGAQYTLLLNEQSNLTFGVVYTPKTIRKTRNEIFDHTIYSNTTNEAIVDTIALISNSKGEIQYPSEFGIGITYNRNKQWTVGADFTYTKWSELLINKKSDSLVDGWKFAIGGEWKPNPYAINYFKRTSYRLGFIYESSYLNLNDAKLSKMAITGGFGFPLRKSSSTINLGIEFGKFGTTNNNLIEERYFQISIAFSASDIWFIKRKYE